MENQINKRASSSSSEGEANTSDECGMGNKRMVSSDEWNDSDKTLNDLDNSLVEQFILDVRERQFRQNYPDSRDRENRPGTS